MSSATEHTHSGGFVDLNVRIGHCERVCQSIFANLSVASMLDFATAPFEVTNYAQKSYYL